MRHIKEYREFKDGDRLHEKLSDLMRRIIPGLRRSGDAEAADNLEQLGKPENAEKVKDNLFKRTARFAQDTWNAIKREGEETKQAFSILQRMVQGEAVSDNEKKFLKAQAGNVAKMLPLVTIQGIPVPFPITPLLIVLGKKYNIDILPKDHRHLLLGESEVAEVEVDLSKSKVVNKDGSPKVAYHGTRARFDKFDQSWMGQTDEGFYGRGFYFTFDKEYASEFGPVVMEVHLDVRNPFYLRTWSTLGSFVELDLRDDLAALKGGPKEFKTDRNIPNGYYLKIWEDEHRNDPVVRLSVHPKEELYGTDKEIYGTEVVVTRDEFNRPGSKKGYSDLAIVNFTDEQRGISIDAGMTNWLLQKMDRWNFHTLLQDNGYDGMFVVGREGDNTHIDDVSEIVVWDSDKIHVIK